MPRWTVLGALAAALAGSAVVPAATDAREKHKEFLLIGAGRGHLGVSLEEVGAGDLARLKLAEEKGALITSVQDGSPADKGGLKENDVVLRFHGEAVLSASQLARLVRETPSGRAVPIEVSRDGAVQKLTVTIEDRKGHFLMGEDLKFEFPVPPEPPDPPEPPSAMSPTVPPRLWHRDDSRTVLRDVLRFRSAGRLGIGFQELSSQLARYFKVDDGVLVTQVVEGSAAAEGGLQAGDVIVKLDGDAIGDGRDLRRALDGAKEEATITVQRDGRPMELKVKLRRPQARRSRRTDT
jgi:serine protease Do